MIHRLFFILSLSFLPLIATGTLIPSEDVPILILKGTSYERGLQHGRFLKNQIALNINSYIDNNQLQSSQRYRDFEQNIDQIMPFIPADLMEEMQGIADGCDLPFDKILRLNLFPEMFHCNGIAVMGSATFDGSLYHTRSLDYSAITGLEQSAVLIVQNPDKGYPFLSFSYAGFVGCLTAMNIQQISIGEVGGLGYGYWQGMPMAFLLREIAQFASSLKEALDILEKTPRTCEYFYLIADGKSNKACGVYATASQLKTFSPGENYALLTPGNTPVHYNPSGNDDKFFFKNYALKGDSAEWSLYDTQNQYLGSFRQPPKDCILLVGFCPKRYRPLYNHLMGNMGKLDAQTLMEVIKLPGVDDLSNVHNAIFHPATLQVWISHATISEPAYNRPYSLHSLKELLSQ